MKFLLAIVLIFPVHALSQDCKINKLTDPFTKETKLSTGFISLTGGSVTIDADKKEIDMFFSLEGIDKCFDNSSMAAIFFEGTKVKMSLRNGGTMNCQGFFHFIFKNTETTSSYLQRIVTQKINYILFTGNDKKETKIIFQPLDQQAISSFTACLVNEAKSLIK